jgi:type IV secretion system protein TrbF
MGVRFARMPPLQAAWRARLFPKATTARSREAPATPGRKAAQRGAANPYLHVDREWNEHFGPYIQQAHRWRLIAMSCAPLALVAVAVAVYVGSESKVVPYVVELDERGAVAAVARADETSAVEPRIVRALLTRFVADWRGVTVDTQAEKGAIGRLYGMLPAGSVAFTKMNDHFRGHNPFVRAASQTVDVVITDVSPIDAHAWQVQWKERGADAGFV